MPTENEFKKLVLLRLEAMPDNVSVSLGSHGELSKHDLIGHVEKGDELGKTIVDMQIKYLQAMKNL